MRRRLVAGLLFTALLGGCGTPDEQVTSGSTTTAAPGAGWEQLPPSPLSPRGGAVLTTLDDGRLLVVGGDTVAGCQDQRAEQDQRAGEPDNEPAASSGVSIISAAALSCAPLEKDPRLRDGAILESATGKWKRIADAPTPLSNPSNGVVLGDTVYFWSWPSFATTGPSEGTWLSYGVSENAWTERAGPPVAHPAYLNVVEAGDRVIAFHGSEERGPVRDLIYDPATDSWSDLPRDPLSPSYDRFMVWTGREAVLLAKELVPNPGSERPSFVRAAAFNPATETWRRLPDSEILGGYEHWWWSADRVVNAAVETSDGGQVNNYGRDYPHGGILDPMSGGWSDLPAGPPPSPGCRTDSPSSSVDTAASYHAAGPDTVVNGGRALHVAEARWETVPCNPEQADFKFTSTWAFDGVVAFGGYDQFGEPGQFPTKFELSNAAWLWRPGE